jgi:FkbM family methyltransferase
LKGIFAAALEYRKAYENHVSISIHLLRRRYPIEAMLKKGGRITLQNRTAVISISGAQNNKNIKYDMPTDTWNISLYDQHATEKIVKLYGGRDNGEIIPIFINGIYSYLPFKGKTIIDIGANIGDSSVYFALRGAEKVIAIEPLPKNYQIAQKNIELNNLSNTITLLLAGCAARPSKIIVDDNYHEIGACVITDRKRDHGTSIPLMTLENILSQESLHGDVILKMDCEGCEYETILSSSNDILRRFSHILIEYHYGYRSLKLKLENCGFIVAVNRPIAQRRDYLYEFFEDKWMYTGYIYATKESLNSSLSD